MCIFLSIGSIDAADKNTKMKTYVFSSDSGIEEIEARTPNAAAREFDPKVKNMKELLAKIERLGGYITITEDDVVIERIAA